MKFQGACLTEGPKQYFLKEDYSTRHFNNIVRISKNGEKLAVLVFGKRNETIKIENFCQLKLENHLFYTKTLDELREITNGLIKDLELIYYGVSRLDIALDFLRWEFSFPE